MKEGTRIGNESLMTTPSSSPLIANANIVSTGVKSSMEDDRCWMLPASDAWKEWIINGPNLCMLMVSKMKGMPETEDA